MSNKIITAELDKMLIKTYVLISKEYHIVDNVSILAKLLEDENLLQLIQQRYNDMGKTSTIKMIRSKTRAYVYSLILNIFNGTSSVINKDTKYILNTVKVAKKSRSATVNKFDYDKNILLKICTELFNTNDHDTKLKRKAIYDMIREEYKKITSIDLDMDNRRLCNFVLYHGIGEINKKKRLIVNEYIAPRYNSGQRLFFSNYVAKEVGLRDSYAITSNINTDLYPGIVLMRSKEYVDNAHTNEYVSANKERLIFEVMVELRDVLYRSTLYELCNVMANNVYLHHRYMTQNDITKFRDDLLVISRRHSTRKMIKQKYGIDIRDWRSNLL